MTEPIHVIHVRGVKEPEGAAGISGTFLNTLDRNRFLPIQLVQPMDYGFPMPFAESYEHARQQVIELIHELIHTGPGRVVLSGYSGGAYVMGDLARDIAGGIVNGIDPAKIAAVALLADPERPEGAGAPGIPTPGGYGIAGSRAVNGVPAFWGTSSADPIASLTADNPLRTVADLSTLWSVDPLKAIPWARNVMHRLIFRQLQPWWMHPFRPDVQLEEAIAALNGYVWQGHHTDDYLRQGICTALADVVNREVA